MGNEPTHRRTWGTVVRVIGQKTKGFPRCRMSHLQPGSSAPSDCGRSPGPGEYQCPTGAPESRTVMLSPWALIVSALHHSVCSLLRWGRMGQCFSPGGCYRESMHQGTHPGLPLSFDCVFLDLGRGNLSFKLTHLFLKSSRLILGSPPNESLSWIFRDYRSLFYLLFAPGFPKLDSSPLCCYFGAYCACHKVCLLVWLLLHMCIPPTAPSWFP